jgi:hypothetical protein
MWDDGWRLRSCPDALANGMNGIVRVFRRCEIDWRRLKACVMVCFGFWWGELYGHGQSWRMKKTEGKLAQHKNLRGMEFIERRRLLFALSRIDSAR